MRVSGAALLRGRSLGEEVCEVVGVGPVPVGDVRRWIDGGASVAVVVTDDDPLDAHVAARLGRHPSWLADVGRTGEAGQPGAGAHDADRTSTKPPGASGPHANVTVVVHVTRAQLEHICPAELQTDVERKGVDLRALVHHGRRPNVVQQMALIWMSPECCVLGCPNQARLEADHLRDWHITRHTVLAELDNVCTPHHRLKTHDGYRLAPGRGKRPLLPP